jgi:hypothetical protein
VALPLVVHGADGSENSLPVVQASEILIKIQNGEPVEYDHVIVKGDLNLSQLRLQTNITSPIRINDSAFDGFVSFNYTNLDESIDLSGSNFTKNAYFREATFSSYADFSGATFSGYAYFSEATFSGNANFYSATFSGYAYFREATFSGYAYFREATFSGNANFYSATFSGDAYFREATFSGYAYFSEATFSGDASFIGATFSGYASFIGATFSGYADFSYATFSGDAYFREATFSGNANFYSATFSGDADFSYATFSGYADFRGATFDKIINFRKSVFWEVLYLRNLDFKEIYLEWDSINNINRNFDGKVYLSIIENYKASGFLSDADNCYYAFRKDQFFRRSITGDPLMYLFDLGAWTFYGFGKKPLFTLIWSIFFILLFGGIWIAMGSKKSRSEIDEYSQIKKWPKGVLDALFFSATLFLSGTKLFVDPPVMPALQGVSRSTVNKVFIAERLLGALFSVLFFLAITGMLIKPI